MGITLPLTIGYTEHTKLINISGAITMIIKYEATTYGIKMKLNNVDASSFPKSYNAWNQKCYDPKAGTVDYYCAIAANFTPDNVNKGQNETGLNRIKKFVAKARQMFGQIEFVRMVEFTNDIELPDEIKNA